MVPCPNYVKSVEVTNTTSDKLKVIVIYDAHISVMKSDVTHSEEIPAGGVFHFEERIYDAEGGSYQVVAPVKTVEVEGGHRLTPVAHGIVGKLQVHAAGAPVHLTQH